MNVEQIQERIKQLEQEREQVRLSLIAYDGALQDCQYWLNQIDDKEKENGEVNPN